MHTHRDNILLRCPNCCYASALPPRLEVGSPWLQVFGFLEMPGLLAQGRTIGTDAGTGQVLGPWLWSEEGSNVEHP